MYKEKKEYQQKKDGRGGIYIYKGPLKNPMETARHYGFEIKPPLTITKRLPSSITRHKKDTLKDKDFSDFPKDYMSSLKKYIDEGMYKKPQPIMVSHIVERPNNYAELRLEIIGTKKSIAEATIIKAANIILDDLGYKNTSIRLNCIGDKESGNGFLRELTNFYRDQINDLSPALQERLKKDVLKIYTNKSEKYKKINEDAPRPLSFLSEDSREHFKELIEYLENMKMDYEIHDGLVGRSSFFPKTIFEIFERKDNNREFVLARGERHNYLAQNIGFNKKIPIVGIGIKIKRRGNKKDSYIFKQSSQHPKIYFIHLGFDAKKKSLDILETFRKSKVPIYQSLCNDSFTHQLKKAEYSRAPYTMIIGQKEVLENSIIFRDMETRYQENVELSNLEKFLRQLKRKKVI